MGAPIGVQGRRPGQQTPRRPIDLVGQLLQSECTWLESSFQREDAPALQALQQAGAIVGGQTNSAVAQCSFCELEFGPIERTEAGLVVHCPDCGPYPLDPSSVRTWRLNHEWLIRRLRGALDIESDVPSTQLTDGIWEIGRHKQRAVVLVRSLDLALRQGLNLFHNAPGRSRAWPCQLSRPRTISTPGRTLQVDGCIELRGDR